MKKTPSVFFHVVMTFPFFRSQALSSKKTGAENLGFFFLFSLLFFFPNEAFGAVNPS